MRSRGLTEVLWGSAEYCLKYTIRLITAITRDADINHHSREPQITCFIISFLVLHLEHKSTNHSDWTCTPPGPIASIAWIPKEESAYRGFIEDGDHEQ